MSSRFRWCDILDACVWKGYEAFQRNFNLNLRVRVRLNYNLNQEKSVITVTIEGTPVKVSIDSCATAYTIDYTTYEAISAAKTVPLKPTNVKLRPYGVDNLAPIPLAGSFFGLINTPSGQTNLTRFLVPKARNTVFLLSRETSTRLGMLHIAASTTTEHLPVHCEYQSLLQKFPALVSGKIGKLREKVLLAMEDRVLFYQMFWLIG